MSSNKNSLPLHRDLPVADTWDLVPMFPGAEAWEKDFAEVDRYSAAFIAFRGRLGESPAVMLEAFEALDRFERFAEKLYCYAHLKSDENTADSENKSRLGKIESKFAEVSGATAWFEPEIMAMDETKLRTFLDAPELEFYRKSMEELLRQRPHILSEKEERLLGLGGDVLGAAGKIFSTLNNADLTFPAVADEHGKKVQLTHGNYIKFLESGRRPVRKRAFEAMFDTYGKFRNTMAATLDGNVKRHVYSAKIRNYPSALEASLFSDNARREDLRLWPSTGDICWP